jgi:S-adenosylmethionine hydrolase
LLGSTGYLEIATNRGAASKLTEAAKGSEVKIAL